MTSLLAGSEDNKTLQSKAALTPAYLGTVQVVLSCWKVRQWRQMTWQLFPGFHLCNVSHPGALDGMCALFIENSCQHHHTTFHHCSSRVSHEKWLKSTFLFALYWPDPTWCVCVLVTHIDHHSAVLSDTCELKYSVWDCCQYQWPSDTARLGLSKTNQFLNKYIEYLRKRHDNKFLFTHTHKHTRGFLKSDLFVSQNSNKVNLHFSETPLKEWLHYGCRRLVNETTSRPFAPEKRKKKV